VRLEGIGATKHVDHVDLLGNLVKLATDRLAPELLADVLAVHGEDSVAPAVEVIGDVVGRARALGVGPQHGDDARLLQCSSKVLVAAQLFHGGLSAAFHPSGIAQCQASAARDPARAPASSG
jgi:hypothetical protein